MRSLEYCLKLVLEGKDSELSEKEMKMVEKHFEDSLKVINDTDKFLEELKIEMKKDLK